MDFFHIVEKDDGSWACGEGRDYLAWREFDELGDAIEQTARLASENAPSEVQVHLVDGQEVSIATFD
jgi:hypothetical protein